MKLNCKSNTTASSKLGMEPGPSDHSSDSGSVVDISSGADDSGADQEEENPRVRSVQSSMTAYFQKAEKPKRPGRAKGSKNKKTQQREKRGGKRPAMQDHPHDIVLPRACTEHTGTAALAMPVGANEGTGDSNQCEPMQDEGDIHVLIESFIDAAE